MAKSANQKLKLFYILSLLQEESDEKHPVSMKQILDSLERNGIHAERKSIYSDMEALRTLGYDVEYQKERPKGYYLGSREFELPELKLLVDAVQASKFITEKQSNNLIKKLETFSSRHEAAQLQRQVQVRDRVKTVNMSTLYLIDDIHQAIINDCAISFVYCEWNHNKKLEPRHDGKIYHVSPWALLWEDENYYLVAYEEETSIMKYFRVDKMQKIEVLQDCRQGREEFKKINLGKLSQKTFRMFAGEEKNLTLEFDNSLIGVAIDHFGNDVPLFSSSKNKFKILAQVHVSSQFYGWLAGLGKGVDIIEPIEEKEKYLEYLRKILS